MWIEHIGYPDGPYIGELTSKFFIGAKEDEGWYCFYSQVHSNYIMSKTLYPTMKISGDDFTRSLDFMRGKYNQNYVWNDRQYFYVFKSPYLGWIAEYSLKEPYYYEDLCCNAHGDGWWKFSKDPTTKLTEPSSVISCSPQGIYKKYYYETSCNPISCQVGYLDVYVLDSDATPGLKYSNAPYGCYYRQGQEPKILGYKTFKCKGPSTSEYKGKYFLQRFETDLTGHNSYYLENSTTRFIWNEDAEKWVMGIYEDPLGSTWIEGSVEPNISSDTTFLGYKLEGGEKVRSPYMDITLAFYNFIGTTHEYSGNIAWDKKFENVVISAYMGDISRWH